MKVKRLSLAMASVAVVAMGAAGNASATATTGGEWYVKASTLVGSATIICATGETIKLTGSVSGIPVVIDASGVECVEATIFNEGGVGKDFEKLVFTGVTVTEPANCTVKGGEIETSPLAGELYRDSASSAVGFDKLEPAPGFSNIAVVHLEGSLCPIAGNRPLKGVIYGEFENATGIESWEQPLNFDASVDATAGSGPTFAGSPAHLDARILMALASGDNFKAK